MNNDSSDAGMPREVAAEILTEPKARITNTFRKQCQRAREFVFIAPPKLAPDPAARGFRANSMAQLLKWLRRAIVQRKGVQNKYVKLDAKAGKFTGRNWISRLRALDVLSAKAQSLETMRDNLEDEITLRQICQKNNS